jgi:hypothetical protein
MGRNVLDFWWLVSSKVAQVNVDAGCAEPVTNPRRCIMQSRKRVQNLSHDALEAALVPLHGLLLGDTMAGTDLGLAAAALGNTLTWSGPVLLSVVVYV